MLAAAVSMAIFTAYGGTQVGTLMFIENFDIIETHTHLFVPFTVCKGSRAAPSATQMSE